MVNTIETADSTEKVRNGNPVVKNETEYTKENYPSAVYLLSVLQSEYNYEADRLSRLDTRSGVFIALLGALLVFLLDKLNIKQILSIQQISLLEAIPHVLMIIFSIVSLASIMYSIYFFISVVSIQEYKRLKLNGFKESNAKYSEEKVALALMVDYKSILEHNNSVNTQKTKKYTHGVRGLSVSLIFAVLTYIIGLFL